MTFVAPLTDARTLHVWREARRSLLAGLALLTVVAILFKTFLSQLPPFTAEELLILRQFPPQSLQGLVAQRNVLQAYAATYPRVVATGLCGAYVFMQTFAVPGTLMLSLLAGALYGAQRAWLLVAAVSTVGSCSCYCLSWLLGRQLVRAAWPAKLDRYAAEVQKRRSDMLNYIIFLRVTPLLPNTFINLASPIVGVPLLPFALGTLIGCAPNNFVAVQAGCKLSELSSLGDLYDRRMLGMGLLVGVVALSPVLLKQRHQRYERLQAGVVNRAR